MVLTSTIVSIVWGSSASLYCSVAPTDTVKIQWTANGAVVDTKLYPQLVQSNSRLLDVHQAMYEDNLLQIMCLVRVNDSAMAAETFQLNVTGSGLA